MPRHSNLVKNGPKWASTFCPFCAPNCADFVAKLVLSGPKITSTKSEFLEAGKISCGFRVAMVQPSLEPARALMPMKRSPA